PGSPDGAGSYKQRNRNRPGSPDGAGASKRRLEERLRRPIGSEMLASLCNAQEEVAMPRIPTHRVVGAGHGTGFSRSRQRTIAWNETWPEARGALAAESVHRSSAEPTRWPG